MAGSNTQQLACQPLITSHTSIDDKALPLLTVANNDEEAMIRHTIAEYIVNTLKKFEGYFDVICAGGVVEWLLGHTSDFSDIDIFIFSKNKMNQLPRFLQQNFSNYQSNKSIIKYASENLQLQVLGQSGILVNYALLGLLKALVPSCLKEQQIIIQFIRLPDNNDVDNTLRLLKGMDIPNVCGSALQLVKDQVSVIRVNQKSKFYLIKKYGHRSTTNEIVRTTDNSDPVLVRIEYDRFRKYCLRLGCNCLKIFYTKAPIEIIKKCKLFGYTRPANQSSARFQLTHFYESVSKSSSSAQ